MTMKAWLEGHEFDLEDLARLLPTDDVRVIKEGDGFYLTAAELDNPRPAGHSTRSPKSCLSVSTAWGD
jgi:hypothetical protein